MTQQAEPALRPLPRLDDAWEVVTMPAAPAFQLPATAPRTVSPVRAGAVSSSEVHHHGRTCWWDVLDARWAGPAHPDPRVPRRVR